MLVIWTIYPFASVLLNRNQDSDIDENVTQPCVAGENTMYYASYPALTGPEVTSAIQNLMLQDADHI